MTITGAIRFVVGASLVAAGGSLAAPLATKLAAVATASARAEGMPAATVPVAAPAVAVPGPSLSQSTREVVPPSDPWAGVTGEVTVDSAGGLQLDRCPPPPPAPLPPPPYELSQSSPALGHAYRSTLQVPPPQLLDAAGPPPTASWAAPLVAATVPAAAPSRARGITEITVPATYCIRDGDDLGTIAGRFYGDTAAAPAIWAANREAVPNPDLLPIGAELRLPPSWAVHGLRRPVAGAIEPVSYARPVAVPAAGGAGPAPHAVPWLAPATDLPVPAAGAGTAVPPPPAGAAGGVRVGPGETLASLARRLYGDPAMADQIFAANRDRLRSPDLVVAGMELRLPRPVTAPRP